MRSLLQQLENNEAILLMYLAGELPEPDRQEVEQLLARDAGLQAQLQNLRAAQEQVHSQIQEWDRQTEPPVADDVAQRQVTRILKQWQVERAARQREAPATPRGLRYPWWVYPTVSAAAILLAFLAWWGHAPPADENQTAGRSGMAQLDPEEAQQVALQLAQSFTDAEPVLATEPDGRTALSKLEEEMLALSRSNGLGVEAE